MACDTGSLASRVDAKLLELQAALGDVYTALSSAGPTKETAAPPGLLFNQEIEEMRSRLSAHELIPAHILDPEVLTARVTRVEESLREILAQAQAPTTAATSRAVVAQDPWQSRPGQVPSFAGPKPALPGSHQRRSTRHPRTTRSGRLSKTYFWSRRRGQARDPQRGRQRI